MHPCGYRIDSTWIRCYGGAILFPISQMYGTGAFVFTFWRDPMSEDCTENSSPVSVAGRHVDKEAADFFTGR